MHAVNEVESPCMWWYVNSQCVPFSASLPPCLPPCLPSSLPACLPPSLPAFIPACFPSSLPPSLPACLPSSLPPSLRRMVKLHTVYHNEEGVLITQPIKCAKHYFK